MEAILAGDAAEERRRLPGDESKGGDLTFAELLERYFLVVIGRHNPDVQQIEQAPRRNRSAGAPQIDVYLLVGQLCDAFDLAPGEQMEFFVIEFGNIGNPAVESGEKVLLLGIVEDIGLQDGHIDP